MNSLDFSFEEKPIDAILASLDAGDTISAAELLTLLEDEDEDGTEDILLDIEQRGLVIDLSTLPRAAAMGEAALRLRREEELVKNGFDAASLDPTDPLRLYMEEVAMTPACGDPQVLAEEASHGDEGAMLRLTDVCLGGVIETAKAHVGHGVLLLDLIQEGSLGLWQAIRTWESGEFLPYADARIRFAMAKAIVLQLRENGLGQRLRTAMEDYRQMDEQLLAELGRNATLEEVAERLHMQVELAQTVQKMLENARTLAQAKKLPEPEEEEIAETQAVEDTAYFQMRQRILDLLSDLDEMQAKLLTLRYGLEGGRPLSAEETGARLNLTAEEVLRFEAEALQKLRNQK